MIMSTTQIKSSTKLDTVRLANDSEYGVAGTVFT
jgi:hypothetical protein